MTVIGYKVFSPDWTCRGYQYVVGSTYKIEGKLKICSNGFHFCEKLIDCFNYYDFNPHNKVAEVHAIGALEKEYDKIATSQITIVRELSWAEVLEKTNTGYSNTGYSNTGHRNSGHRNSGNYNSGNYNSGYYNSGNSNTGDHNSGHYNCGNRNTGHFNTGHFNTGNHNTGNFNTGDSNTGMFNTISPEPLLFNKPFSGNLPLLIIPLEYEIEEYPSKNKVKISYKDAWKIAWFHLSPAKKSAIINLPNFDPAIFEEITGLKKDIDY